MKNKVQLLNRMMQVQFIFPITVGQIKLDAIGQVYITKNSKTNKLEGEFEFIDQENETYMGLPVKGHSAWTKLREFHNDLGININQLINEEFDKIVDEDFKKDFLNHFNLSNF